jgi:TonB-linked SusC/RagA family outer membrane protein
MIKRSLHLVIMLILCGLQLMAQINYTGSVRDAVNGDPLIGVSVLIQDTNTGTITDFEGQFSIEAFPGDILEISYVGYQPVSLKLTDDPVLMVTLGVNQNLLDEIVVVGYGTTKKSDLTGSVASIKAEDITKVAAANAMQSLQGKVAGLQIMSTSGDPGAAPVVRLRGITTLNNNNPIAVIDGVITDISAVSLINSQDIASVEVLKDASATAIYGSRGAAGVVIITTKKGEAGKNRVNVNFEQGFASVANQIDVMSGPEFATYVNGIYPGTYNNLDALPNVNWQDEIFQDFTPITNANFSVSGGGEYNRFYFGLGYYAEEGIVPKSGLDRLTGKLNLEFSASKNIDLGLDFSILVSDKQNAPGVINTSLRAWPVQSPYLADGVTFGEVTGGNPLAAIEYSNSNSANMRGLGNLYAKINFLKDFTFKSSVQFDVSESKTRSFVPRYYVAPLQQNEVNDLSYGTSNSTNLIFENTLAYLKEYGKHSVNGVAGYTVQDLRGEYLSGSTEGLIREDPLFWYLNAGQNDFEQVGNNMSRQTLISYLGRAHYTFNSRYMITISARRDGSSNFGPNNKYGDFYSVATGWNISNESFFPAGSPVNNLKLRLSYGAIGNEKIPGTAQYALIVTGVDAVFGENENLTPGASFSGGGNPDLKWESTTQFNAGLNIGVWEDKLMAELDFYQKHTSDILVPLEPIGYTGIGAFQSIYFNAADVVNTGVEWNVSYRDVAGPFSYQLGILGTTISNEVTDIGQGFGADSLLVGGDLGNGQQVARTAVGHPVGFFYGYEVIGVFQNAEDLASNPHLFNQKVGDLKFKDVDGDGNIDGDDRTVIGNSIPSLIYGFNVELGYRSFTLSADFQGQYGNDIYNGKQAIRYTLLNYEDKYNNYWTGDGSTDEHPRPTEGGANFQPSSYFIEDGSFLRLRTLTLNYRMPQSLIERLKIGGANIYLRANNLLTLTSFTGYSPEIGAGSAIDGVIDQGYYPITRVFSIGCNIDF